MYVPLRKISTIQFNQSPHHNCAPNTKLYKCAEEQILLPVYLIHRPVWLYNHNSTATMWSMALWSTNLHHTFKYCSLQFPRHVVEIRTQLFSDYFIYDLTFILKLHTWNWFTLLTPIQLWDKRTRNERAEDLQPLPSFTRCVLSSRSVGTSLCGPTELYFL